MDGSSPDWREQSETSEKLITELAAGVPLLTVYNKQDLTLAEDLPPQNGETVYLSARTGDGLDALKERIALFVTR